MSIDAMKQALEDICAAKLCEMNSMSSRHEMIRLMDKAINTLRERLAQPEQEPVAWMYHGIRHDDTPHMGASLIWKPEYMDVMSAEKGAKATPLYTAPRQWQGLTRQEFLAATQGLEDLEDCWMAIEAKLKEKNS